VEKIGNRVITELKEKRLLNKNFLVFDIETTIVKVGDYNLHSPMSFAVGASKQKRVVYKTIDDMRKDKISDLISLQVHLMDDLLFSLLDMVDNPKYEMMVFAHNGSKFDMVLLMTTLDRWGQVEILWRDGLLSVKYVDNDSRKTLVFRDSYRILNMSLGDACKSFGVAAGKTSFPYKFLTEDTLNYVGPVPGVEYWKSAADYKSVASRTSVYDMKSELKTYNIQDVVCLIDVLNKFRSLYSDHFRIDPLASMSTSSLALATYRTKFYHKTTTPIVKMYPETENAIRNAYLGGRVEVVRHIAEETLYHYDVVSLYPTVMKQELYPIGEPKHVTSMSLDSMGFVRAEVRVPQGLVFPPLLKRNESVLIGPTGNWEDWFFMPELKYATKYGVEVVRQMEGFMFDSGRPFESFVDALFDMKQKADKSGDLGMRGISKLLMNSLYGRFGLSPETINMVFGPGPDTLSDKELHRLYELYFLRGTDRCITCYAEKNDDMISNVSIAAAVTSYSRMLMHPVLNKLAEENRLFYTDTDSIFCTGDLDESLVGSNLGQFELKGEVRRACFAAGKLYSLEQKKTKNTKKTNGEFVLESKCKGVNVQNEKFTVDDLISLCRNVDPKPSIMRGKQQWMRLADATVISIRDMKHEVKGDQANKRVILTDGEGVYKSTRPFHLVNGELNAESMRGFESERSVT
jgi:DNA polymerase elongation subunit (family B)